MKILFFEISWNFNLFFYFSYDFYLISQSVRDGTVAPTYYNVLHEGSPANTPSAMQLMTYRLCHLYYNWTGTIRLPAVVQYAKKLAFLYGQTLHSYDMNIRVGDQKLYFL